MKLSKIKQLIKEEVTGIMSKRDLANTAIQQKLDYQNTLTDKDRKNINLFAHTKYAFESFEMGDYPTYKEALLAEFPNEIMKPYYDKVEQAITQEDNELARYTLTLDRPSGSFARGRQNFLQDIFEKININ